MLTPHGFAPSIKLGGLVCGLCKKGRTHILHSGLEEQEPVDDRDQPNEPVRVSRRKPAAQTPKRAQARRPSVIVTPQPEDPAEIQDGPQDEHEHQLDPVTPIEFPNNQPVNLLDLVDRGVALANCLPDSDLRDLIVARCAELFLAHTNPDSAGE